jgi:hypothetical protein
MTQRPSPDTTHASYHIWLKDSRGTGLGLKLSNARGSVSGLVLRRSPYPRSTLRVNSGTGQWTDLQPPYGQLTKNIFTGGLGMKDLEADQTKYYFASNVWTCGAGGLMLAPQWFHGKTVWPIKVENVPIPSSTPAWKQLPVYSTIAVKITVGAANLVTAGIRLPIRSTGNPGVMGIYIYDNNATGVDHPGVYISGTAVTANLHLLSSSERNFTFTTPITLTAATKYWVLLYFSNGVTAHDYTEYLELVNASFPASTSPDLTTWTAGATPFSFSLLTTTDIKDAQFVTYQQATYCWMTDSDSAKTVHLFINGDQGMADDNTADLTKLNDATKTGATAWVADQFKGAIVRIYSGPGKDEWRKITANGTNYLTVDRAWNTIHVPATTVYTIIGSPTWTEITGHGLVGVKDATAGENNGILYFAQGSEDLGAGVPVVRKMRARNNAGTWEFNYDADNAGGADLLLSTYDQTAGSVIWRARNGKDNNDVAGAVQPAWATDLVFDTPADITLGSKEQDITGLLRWGNKVGVLCMDRIWALLDSVPDLIGSWESSWDSNTGRRPVLMSSYLVFPKGNNLFRLVGDLLEDFGPESYDGLPRRYSGQYVDLWSEEGGLLAAKRSGSLMQRAYTPTGESGVYMYRSGGWHPVALLDQATGMNAIYRQRLDNKHDMLWMATADTLFYMYMPRAFDYRLDGAFMDDPHMCSDGCILLGKMTAGTESLDKWWSTLNLYGVDLHTTYTNVEVYYRTTEPVPTAAGGWSEQVNSDWTYLGEAYGDISKIIVQVKSKQMWLLIRLVGDGAHTPVVQAVTMDYMARVDSADMWPVSFRLDDMGCELNGEFESVTARQAMDILDEWARDITPLTMTSSMYLSDSKSVVIERPSYQPIALDLSASSEQGREVYLGNMNILESGVELYRKLNKLGSAGSFITGTG